MRGHRDLRRTLAAAVLCAALTLVLPFEALRLVFAAPLALFLPGYAIASATFARHPIDRVRFLLLSLGLSLAVLALGALVLNYMPGGIRAGSWALLLIVVVAGGCRGAAVRRPAAARPGPARPRLSPSRREGALLAAGALAASGAIVLTFLPVSAKDAIGYSEIWIQPFNGDVAGVRIGVGNRMQNPGRYRLRVTFGGEDGVTTARDFTLEPGQSELLRLPVIVRPTDRPLPVSAVLFRVDGPNRAFRRVSAWIPPPGDRG